MVDENPALMPVDEDSEDNAVGSFGIVQVKRDDVAGRSSRNPRHFVERVRFQVIVGTLVCIVAPMLARAWYDGVPLLETRLLNSGIISAFALLVGYYASRSMMPFRGVTIATFASPTLSASFAMAALVPLFARIEYSRVQMATHFILAILFFILTDRIASRRRKLLFAVIPGGRVSDIPAMDGIEQRRLRSAKEEFGNIDCLVADLDVRHSVGWDRAMTRAMLAGIPIYDWRQLAEQLSGTVQIDHITQNSIGTLNPNQFYLKFKHMVEPILAIVALVVVAPLLVLIAAAIRIETPGSPIFGQKRTGYRAQTFTIYKFRTMQRETQTDMSPQDERQRAITRVDDPRITRVGRFLRKTRLDELPQLINVALMQMSFIGPRPEALALTLWYENELPFYHYRHIIKPGITGWAQVNQGHVTDIDDIRLKLSYDFYYAKYCSIWLDLLIVGRTIITAVSATGAR